MFTGNNIRAEMARLRKGVGKMAEELGMSSNSFRFKMNGKREFTLSELDRMAAIFKCSIDYLVDRDKLTG